jgi:hypothetical protein
VVAALVVPTVIKIFTMVIIVMLRIGVGTPRLQGLQVCARLPKEIALTDLTSQVLQYL